MIKATDFVILGTINKQGSLRGLSDLIKLKKPIKNAA